MADYAIHDTTLIGTSNIIRKKEGSSALIDPADYPKRINLMGMLEEKTVSGAIVTFPDGADTVPLKKCEITLPASLDGYSEVDVNHAGTSYGTFTNGYGIGLDGLPQPTASRVTTLNPITIDPDMTYKVYSATNQRFIIGVLNNGTLVRRTANISSGSNIDTSGGTDLYVCMYNAQGNTVTVEKDKPIVFASTEVIDTHTADLGRTVHGGSGDIVNGQGTGNTSEPSALNSRSWAKTTVGGHTCFYANLPNGLIDASGIIDGDCDTYDVTTDALMGTDRTIRFYCSLSYNFSRCLVRDDRYSELSANEFKAVVDGNIVYQLATPETFTFDPVPIDSKYGNNTLWSEQGDTEVTYRSMGTVYQYPEGEGVSF